MQVYDAFPEIPEQWRATRRRALAGEVLRNDAERFVRADGPVQWIRWEVRPWHGPGGHIGGIPIYSEDLTRLKSQEESLRESSGKLDAIIGTAMDAIISVDESGKVVVFNAAAEAMFGCTRADAIGAPLEVFIPARHRCDHSLRMQEFGASSAAPRRMGRSRVVTGLRSSGEEFAIEASISHVPVAGRCVYTVIIRDVTERHRTERALNAAHSDLQRLRDAQDHVQEDERKRISRELHDELQQMLAAIKMDLSVAGDRVFSDPAFAMPSQAPDVPALEGATDGAGWSGVGDTGSAPGRCPTCR